MKFEKFILGGVVFAALAGSVFAGHGVVSMPLPDEHPVWRRIVQAGVTKKLNVKSAINAPVWQKVPKYPMMRALRTAADLDKFPREGGFVQYISSDEYFFIRAEIADSDVLSSGTKNQTHLYLMGDLIEVFVKPLKHNYYWEVYGTPNKLFSRFYFPSKGRFVPSCFDPTDVVIRVDAKVKGTFNNQTDRDRGWISLIAIPRKELEKNGLRFAKGSMWTVFTSRYNYSRYLPADVEHSSHPQINGSYHNTEHYALIEFINID